MTISTRYSMSSIRLTRKGALYARAVDLHLNSLISYLNSLISHGMYPSTPVLGLLSSKKSTLLLSSKKSTLSPQMGPSKSSPTIQKWSPNPIFLTDLLNSSPSEPVVLGKVNNYKRLADDRFGVPIGPISRLSHP